MPGIPGQTPPPETAPETTQAQTPPTTSPQTPTLAQGSKPAAAPAADDALVQYETDDPKVSGVVSKANKQAAQYRDQRNQERVRAEALAADLKAAQGQIAELSAIKAKHEKAVVDFSNRTLDHHFSQELVASGATPEQVTRLLPALRAEAAGKVKVKDDFTLDGDTKPIIESFTKAFGFGQAPQAKAPPSSDPAAAPGAGGSNTATSMFGQTRRNAQTGRLETPATDPEAARQARAAEMAKALEDAAKKKG